MADMDVAKVATKIGDKIKSIDEMLEEINFLTEMIAKEAAPPFKEERRGSLIREKFEKLGYPTFVDSVGNIIASMNLSSENRDQEAIIVCAHLDTVFPENTEIILKREDGKMIGPGVGDDARGLTNLLVIAQLLKDMLQGIPLYFIANVGEEGIGDLRGTKHIFNAEEHKERFAKIRYFVTIDSTGAGTIVNQSIGSKRYRISFLGPGGHSFQQFGTVNPIYPLGNFISEVEKIKVSEMQKTTYNIGIVEGGISVNAIPTEGTCLVDLRSESTEELNRLERKVLEFAREVTETENRKREGKIQLKIEKIGDRPAGKCSSHSQLLKVAIQATRHFGIEPNLKASSTDANIPQSKGIEAIAVSGTADGGNAHSPQEWIDISQMSLLPIKRNLLLIATLIEEMLP